MTSGRGSKGGDRPRKRAEDDVERAETLRDPSPGARPPSGQARPSRGRDSRDLAGAAFGRYRLLEELGRGAMGVVWKAWDTELRRLVALKQVLQEKREGPVMRERFLREARAAARLRHPGIVPVYDVGVHDGRPYFTAEFVEGRTLDAVLSERLPLRQAVEIVARIAEALEHAHRQGIVHRDVKPGNVLVDAGGNPRVTDFGLAREFEAASEDRLTRTGAILGTPRYMSPEQADGKGARVGPASDQFSLGVVLYEALAGRAPFHARTIHELLVAVWQKDPEPPSRANRRVPKDLDTIVMKTLEKDPARRYESMADFATDLRRFLEGEPISARPLSLPTRVWRRAARRRVIVLPAAALSLLLLGIAAWALAYAARGASEVEEAREKGERAQAAATERTGRVEARERALLVLETARAPLEQATAGLYEPDVPLEQVALWAGEAREGIEAALELAPELALGHHFLGRTRELLGDYGLAESSWREAVRLQPDFAPAHLALGRALLARAILERLATKSAEIRLPPPFQDLVDEGTREIEAALAAERGLDDEIQREFARAIRTVFADPDATVSACREAARRFGRRRGAEELHWLAGLACPYLEAALADLDAAIEIRPRFPLALLARSALRRDGGDHAGALSDSDAAVVLAPHLALAYEARGRARFHMDDLAGALADFEEAIRLDAGRAIARVRRAGLLMQRGDYPGGIAELDEAIRLDPACPDYYLRRAEARERTGELAGALEDYNAAIEKDPHSPMSWYERATFRGHHGDIEGAIADYGETIRLAPGHVEAWVDRGSCRHVTGDYAGAIADYDEAIRLGPRKAIAYAYRGAARIETGDLAGATADADAVVAVDPAYIDGHLFRSEVYERKGDRRTATLEIRAALALAPPDWPRRAEMEAAIARLERSE